MHAVRISLAALTAAALVSTAAPAQAATVDEESCSVSVTIPSKLVITSWSSVVKAELQDPTGCAEYASWTFIKGSEDASAIAIFSSPVTTDRVSFYTGPSGNHPGTYTAVPSNAYSDETYTNADGFDEAVTVVQEDSDPMVAKYGSKLSWVAAKRIGSAVTLKARALRYSPSAAFGGYVTWKQAKVLVQKRVGTTWRTVKSVRTDSKGVATARVSGAKRSWRLVTADSSSVWGKATSSKKR